MTMWNNRITEFVPTHRNRLTPAAAAATACCGSGLPALPPGAFVVPPASGPQPSLYELARSQAIFVLRRRSRSRYVSPN